MISNFTIKNFRGLAAVLLNPCRRINLIAGKNNTGKTAILEALWLHANPSDCWLPLKLNQFRGMSGIDRAAEEICRWLFVDGDPRHGVQLISSDENGINRDLQIRMLDPATSRQKFPDAERELSHAYPSEIASGNHPRIVLQFQSPGMEETTSIGVVTESTVIWNSAGIGNGGWSGFISSSIPEGEAHDIELFGMLELSKRQDEILPALRVIEPRLESLRLAMLGGRPAIHGDVGLPRLIPVAMMGEGVRRVLSIIMGVVAFPNATVLIDEIENGLHHSIMGSIWESIATAAKQSGTQVFATTHSFECIRAAHEAFESRAAAGGDIYDFALHRLERSPGGAISAVSYDQHTLETSLDLAWEVR